MEYAATNNLVFSVYSIKKSKFELMQIINIKAKVIFRIHKVKNLRILMLKYWKHKRQSLLFGINISTKNKNIKLICLSNPKLKKNKMNKFQQLLTIHS